MLPTRVRQVQSIAMQEEVTDFDRYRYESFDGMEDAEDEMLLGASTLKKMREGAPAATEAAAEEETREDIQVDVSDIFPGAAEAETEMQAGVEDVTQ